jgi:hypothetical protein
MSYAFKVPQSDVEAAINKEFSSLNSVMIARGKKTTYWADLDNHKIVVLTGPVNSTKVTCMAQVTVGPSWLERQWLAIRSWFTPSRKVTKAQPPIITTR